MSGGVPPGFRRNRDGGVGRSSEDAGEEPQPLGDQGHRLFRSVVPRVRCVFRSRV